MRILQTQSQIIIVSNSLILEDGSSQRKHRKCLNSLLASTKGMLRIASAYVTDRELLTGTPDRWHTRPGKTPSNFFIANGRCIWGHIH